MNQFTYPQILDEIFTGWMPHVTTETTSHFGFTWITVMMGIRIEQ